MEPKKQFTKLQQKLSIYFSDWLASPHVVARLRDKPKRVFDSYLAGGDEVAILASHVAKLSAWHLGIYANSALKHGEPRLQDLALCARYSQAAIKFNEALADAGAGGFLLPWEAALYFSANVIVGWKAEANSVALSMLKGIDTSLLDLRRSEEHDAGSLYRHFWFLLQLYCDARNFPLDVSQYSRPDDMSPYDAVLGNWRTPDPAQVEALVNAMANFHLSEAKSTAYDEIAEFDTEDRMLFQYEILTFLRLREWAGLENPRSFEHPLMNQPLAWLPQPTPLPLPQPDTPLLDAVVTRFRDDFPGSFEV